MRDRTSDDELGTTGPLGRGTSVLWLRSGPLDDEIAIDFPAVSRITARICDALAREDERPRRPQRV